MLRRTLLAGLAAGAAGTTALNAATYVDMVVRARPASGAPSRLAGVLLHRAGVGIPGEQKQQQNRLDGLGPLTGIATGVGVGVAQALAHRYGPRIPFVVAALGAGATAMAASDVPLALTGVSDPKSWGTAGWLSDALPHLAFGLASAAVIGHSLPR